MDVEQKRNVVLKNRVPIIIPVFNAVEYTKQAVETIRRNTHPNLYEVIFVDNGSTDGTKSYLRQLIQEDPDHFRVVTNETNKGFAGGMNTGLQLISSFQWEYACLANNDLLFTPNWLVQLLDCIQHAAVQNLGAVGVVSNFAGGMQGIAANYKTTPEIDPWAATWHQVHKDEWQEAGMLVGLCFLMSRKFFDTVGMFDERFVGGMWEDNDLCLRGRLAGFKYVIDRSTFLHHFGNKTMNQNKELDARHLFRSNKKRYVQKWTSTESPFEEYAKQNAKARGAEPEIDANGLVKKFVVAACRVKDGANYIERTLQRISEFADEIVVLVSKLTTDNTKEICQKFPKVVMIEDDNDDQAFQETESRNRVIAMAYSRHPDWIWNFDHDEIPEPRIKDKLHLLTNPRNPQTLLWTFPIVQLWNNENQRRMDGVWGNFYQGRMFRALPGLKIENANSLIHCGSHPTFAQDNCGLSLVKIVHYGNVDATNRKKKYERYTKIDTDKDLNMVLGGHKDYYWQLYYGQPDPNEKAAFTGRWTVAPDPSDWKRPKYGQFFDRDAYRHVYDETNAKFVPYGEHPTVSLCLLIHNESRLLVDCLSSARAHVDEIICVDTGCNDDTPEIAEQMGAEVYEFEWNNDFSSARNFSLSKATCDWILRLDPDEQLPPDTAMKIPYFVREPNVEGFIFPIMNWLETPVGNMNAQWALSETCRLFKNMYPKVRYSGLVHEELDDSFFQLREERKKELLAKGLTEQEVASKGSLLNIVRSPFALWHFGYLRGKDILDAKFDYYCKLGLQQIEIDPKDARPYFTTAVHYMHVGDYDKAIQNYAKTLELDPNHHMAANDVAVMYWQQGRLDKAEEYFKKALSMMNGAQSHQFHRDRVIKNLQKVRTQVLSLTLLP